MEAKLAKLQKKLAIKFKSHKLLVDALTHASYAREDLSQKSRSFGRLAFLGDAVLELVVRDELCARQRNADEGKLTIVKRHYTSEESLVRWARDLELGGYLRLGRGEEKTHGRTKPSILASVFEALVGAIYLDQGMKPARRLILRLMHVQEARPLLDSKSALQIRFPQSKISYRLVGSGPDHDRRFTASVMIDSKASGSGKGHSKKEAEQAAAADALVRIGAKGKRRTERDEGHRRRN